MRCPFLARTTRANKSKRTGTPAQRGGGRAARWLPWRQARFEGLETRRLLSANPLVVNTAVNGLDSYAVSDTYSQFQSLLASQPATNVSLRDAVAIANNTAAYDAGQTPKVDPGTFAISFNTSDAALPEIALPATIELTQAAGASGDAAGSGLAVSSQIAIQGPAAAGGVTIDQSGSLRLFLVTSSGNLTLDGLTLSGGLSLGSATAIDGGGAVDNQGTLTVRNSTLSGNIAQGGTGGGAALGGAVFNQGTLTVLSCTLSGNTAIGGPGATGTQGGLGWGGAVCNFGALTLLDSTLSGNTAQGGPGGRGGTGSSGGAGGWGEGGGLFDMSYGAPASATIYNCTLAGNTAAGGAGGAAGAGNSPGTNGYAPGGGISNINTGATVNDCTIAGNTSDFGGGVFSVASGTGVNVTLTFNNTIVTGSITTATSDFLAESAAGGTSTLQGTANLISVLAIADAQTTNDLTDTITGPADLGPLADNGGPTETMALQPGSAAIAAGNLSAVASALGWSPSGPPIFDQRGGDPSSGWFFRVVKGGIDVGAYQTQAPTDIAESGSINVPAATEGTPVPSTPVFKFTADNTTLGDIVAVVSTGNDTLYSNAAASDGTVTVSQNGNAFTVTLSNYTYDSMPPAARSSWSPFTTAVRRSLIPAPPT